MHLEFECEKNNFKEKYSKLLNKYNELLEQNKELENNIDKIFPFKMDSKIIENKIELFFIYILF